MNNDNHQFQPKIGTIQGVHYAKDNEVAIVIETSGRKRFVVVYSLRTDRWVHNDTYELGFLEVYQGEYPEQHEKVFGVGESIIYGENEIISIEIEGNSVHFVRFEIDHYGYWYILDYGKINCGITNEVPDL